jgi:quercetin dioxygenase-like cupin family protein
MRLSVLTAAAVLAIQTFPPPFPREGTTKLFENERVVAWRLDWIGGTPTPMHEHAMDLVAVVLAGGRTRLTSRDGTVQTRDLGAGDALFQPRGVIHIEELVANEAQSIAIELKDGPARVSAPNTSAPEGFPRDGARLVLDNARVALWDYTWLTDRPVGLHIHNRDTVLVPVTAGEIRVQFRNGETRISRLVPGEVMFFSGAEAHSEQAIAGSPRAIVVELK